MLPLKFPLRWRIASVVLLLAVLAAAIMPAVWVWPDRGQLGDWVEGIDKWAHASVFAVLAVWFSGQYRVQSYWRIAMGLLAFGLLIEACQRMVVYRTAEWYDVAADAGGIMAGLLIALAGLGGWCLRFEAWWQNRKN